MEEVSEHPNHATQPNGKLSTPGRKPSRYQRGWNQYPSSPSCTRYPLHSWHIQRSKCIGTHWQLQRRIRSTAVPINNTCSLNAVTSTDRPSCSKAPSLVKCVRITHRINASSSSHVRVGLDSNIRLHSSYSVLDKGLAALPCVSASTLADQGTP